MGNTSTVPEAGPEMADLDKFIINVTFCDCKCKLSVSTDRGGERMEELEVITEPNMLDQEVAGVHAALTASDWAARVTGLQTLRGLVTASAGCKEQLLARQ